MDLSNKRKIKYRRSICFAWDFKTETYDLANKITGNIIEMLETDHWLDIDDISWNATEYNRTNHGPNPPVYETDPLKIAEYMAVLAYAGLISVTQTEEVLT
jgi:hypothetical protein